LSFFAQKSTTPVIKVRKGLMLKKRGSQARELTVMEQ